MNDIAYYVISALAVLVTLTVHEYFHAYSAYKLGDPTARNMGRLTLNPLKHLDPVGAVCMVFFHFGWAKPVPINLRNFKKPRRDFAISALAGPLSNLFMAFISVPIYLLLLKLFMAIETENTFSLSMMTNFLGFVYVFHVINIGIAIFNLIPIPPLDGSRLLGVILPPRVYYAFLRHERTIYFALLGWLLLGSIVSTFLLSIPTLASSPIIQVIAMILDLSEIIGIAIQWISDAIFNLFSLIPFFK